MTTAASPHATTAAAVVALCLALLSGHYLMECAVVWLSRLVLLAAGYVSASAAENDHCADFADIFLWLFLKEMSLKGKDRLQTSSFKNETEEQ